MTEYYDEDTLPRSGFQGVTEVRGVVVAVTVEEGKYGEQLVLKLSPATVIAAEDEATIGEYDSFFIRHPLNLKAGTATENLLRIYKGKPITVDGKTVQPNKVAMPLAKDPPEDSACMGKDITFRRTVVWAGEIGPKDSKERKTSEQLVPVEVHTVAGRVAIRPGAKAVAKPPKAAEDEPDLGPLAEKLVQVAVGKTPGQFVKVAGYRTEVKKAGADAQAVLDFMLESGMVSLGKDGKIVAE